MALPAMRTTGTIGRWDPFAELDRWLESVTDTTPATTAWSPTADVRETDVEFVFDVELPGVAREDISVEATGNRLAITGELKQEEETEGRYHRRARRTGKFSYSVTLPRGVDTERVEASLESGVLTVRVPKAEKAQPRRIEITAK
jgi:HSP20 family protein